MYTPLSLALEYKHNDAAKLLLTHGARADVSVNWHSWHSGDRKTTPLLLYINNHSTDINILSLLIAAGGNVDQEGYNVIHDYIGHGMIKSSALITAIDNNNKEAVKYMLSYSNNVNGMLHHAIYHIDTSILELLLNYPGVNVNTLNSSKETILHRAIYKEKYNAVRVILNTPGVDIGIISYKHQTPFDTAVTHKRYEAMKLLLSHHDQTKVKELAEGCIHLAAYKNDPTMLAMLVDAGVDKSYKNYKGKTPLDIAIENDKKKAIKWLS
jgi:ankyrin repeat protein